MQRRFTLCAATAAWAVLATGCAREAVDTNERVMGEPAPTPPPATTPAAPA